VSVSRVGWSIVVIGLLVCWGCGKPVREPEPEANKPTKEPEAETESSLPITSNDPRVKVVGVHAITLAEIEDQIRGQSYMMDWDAAPDGMKKPGNTSYMLVRVSVRFPRKEWKPRGAFILRHNEKSVGKLVDWRPTHDEDSIDDLIRPWWKLRGTVHLLTEDSTGDLQGLRQMLVKEDIRILPFSSLVVRATGRAKLGDDVYLVTEDTTADLDLLFEMLSDTREAQIVLGEDLR
jgi:hypothetical protein